MRDHITPHEPAGSTRSSKLPAETAPSTTEKKIDHRKLRRTRRPPRSLPHLANEYVLTEKELLERIPLDRHTIARMVAEKRFPAPIQLTNSKKGWIWSRVLAWLNEREEHPIRQRVYFGRDERTELTE